MFDYLINHAVQNAWSNPSQDLQVILKAARISPTVGIRKNTPHLWGSLTLPTSTHRYHLFQVGQLHPSLIGLLYEKGVWHSLSYLMGRENLIADLYTNSGLHLPRFESWVLVTQEKNLLLAIREQPRITDLRTENVFLRLYSNSYFSSDRADALLDKIECKGIRIIDATQALDFQRQYQDSLLRTGKTSLFVNGIYQEDFLPNSVILDDIVEFVYDSTVKKVIDFSIAELDTFDSILDNKRKYLIHYPGPQLDGPMIDYRDDIDVYLIKKSSVNGIDKWRGIYYHKNQNDSFRMVTHRDYSIAVTYVNGYMLTRPEWTDVQQLTLRLVIRNSGYKRPLINEHHRIKELYKLSESDIKNALLGTDSSVEVWQAASLENSYYPKIMDSLDGGITRTMIQEGYGYNAISKLIADSPIPVQVVNGRRQISLPVGLQSNSTMYEYDSTGTLLGYYYHTLGAEYTPINVNTQLVEGIVGRGSFKLSLTFNKPSVPVDPIYNTRFYKANVNSLGVLDNDSWQDVTGDNTQYMLVDGNVIWLTDSNITATAVKSDKDFLAYDFDLTARNGLLKFSITASAQYEIQQSGVLFIPVGKLDLWLNGKSLIENLDYFVKWPEVIIVNKKFLVAGDTQKITVRGTGFSKSDMSRETPQEVDFVRYGQLSRNQRFNIRDDKVVRIVANGCTIQRSTSLFAEENPVTTMTNVPNGSPYIIEDVIVPLRDLVDDDTYSLRDKSLLVDKAVEDYLTLKNPEVAKVEPDFIPDKYSIYSPFSSTVMYDMLNGILSIDNFKAQYSDMDVINHLQSYTTLLDFDPTQKTIDYDHVAIHPHNLLTETVLDIYQYNFLNRAIKVFLDNKVDITRFISIKPTWI